MQHERGHSDEDNLAQIWRSAQQRRTADIYFGFTHFLRKTSAAQIVRSPASIFPTALAWKLLNAIRAVRRAIH
jgi:hypothetical protein